jgi:ParB/RepB/Spo0J family partition protein
MKRKYQELIMELIDRPEELARLEIKSAEIQSLADSIRERGLQQPIKVAKRGERFMIVFGDRRYLACRLLGHKALHAEVVEATDEEIAIGDEGGRYRADDRERTPHCVQEAGSVKIPRRGQRCAA